MTAYNHVVLDLDITGINPDNRIVDEPHSLSNRPNRSIAPKLGPFFGQGLIVRDGSTTLTRGEDYQIVELHQEATLLYGKEIASVILVINSSISSNVTITYQALGGHYTYCGPTDAIVNIYESVMNDNRSVAWTNVFNKPTEYPPTIHRHLLDDIYGFEPVVDYLERIKRAITLGQVEIVLEIIYALLGKFKCRELPKALPSSKLIQYDALLFFLSRRKILNNIWVDRKECKWYKGMSHVVQVDTSGYPVGTTLYWEFYKPGNAGLHLFVTKGGALVGNGGIVDFSVYTPSNPGVIDDPIYIGIKEHPSDIDYKAVTYIIEVYEPVTTTSAYGTLLMNDIDNNELNPFVAEYDMNDEKRIWYQMNNY